MLLPAAACSALASLPRRLFSRLALLQQPQAQQQQQPTGRRSFRLTAALWAEPLKKKKRIDPQVELERIRKKTRRIEKEIKRLEQRGRYLKPLDEIEGERQFLKTLASRVRPVPVPSEADLERRALLMKDWTRYKWAQLQSESRLLSWQRGEMYRAMEHLKQLDRSLFDAAAQPDASLLGLTLTGPLFTPPLLDADNDADNAAAEESAAFEAADGDYKDVTPSYKYNFEMDKKMLFIKK